MLEKIRAALGTTSPLVFLEVLDRRMERGKIGTGLLVMIAQDAAAEYKARPPKMEPDTSHIDAASHQYSLENARYILAHPEECTAMEQEWAKEFLEMEGAA
jgi:hypothetical protein